jgi:hypothetical protein
MKYWKDAGSGRYRENKSEINRSIKANVKFAKMGHEDRNVQTVFRNTTSR